MIAGIDHIDMAVRDVDRSVELFQKMGFQVVDRNAHHAGTVEVALPGANQPIFDLHPATSDHLEGNTGVVHIAFRVNDAQETFKDLASSGIACAPASGPHFVESTQRRLFSIPSSGDGACLGPCYVQFVGPERKEVGS